MTTARPRTVPSRNRWYAAGDGTGRLVPERERQLIGQRSGRPLHEVQVGVAEPGRLDPQQHLARTGLRHRNGDHLGLALPAQQPDRAHAQAAGQRLRARGAGPPPARS